MLNEMVSIQIRSLAREDKYARYEIMPLEPSFGITVGNALRRVLLNDIVGAAVTHVRIDGVLHEYTTIPGVKEDVIEILLNIKELAIRITDVADTSQPQTAHLRVKGAGEVTGADIEMPTGYEIANPEQHIAELTSQRAKLDMEMTIEVGKGFSPADRIDRSRLDIGVIPVDAIYTPIKKVNFSVEPTRVGTISNYERLVLEVWTNGTIDPDQALVEAAHRLIEHFRLFLGLGIPRRFMAVLLGVEEAPAALAEALLERSLDTIGLSGRVVGVLARAGINTLGDLVNRTREELNGISGFGPQALEEVENALSQLGLKLKVAEEVPTEQEPVEVGSAEGSESE